MSSYGYLNKIRVIGIITRFSSLNYWCTMIKLLLSYWHCEVISIKFNTMRFSCKLLMMEINANFHGLISNCKIFPGKWQVMTLGFGHVRVPCNLKCFPMNYSSVVLPWHFYIEQLAVVYGNLLYVANYMTKQESLYRHLLVIKFAEIVRY